MRIQQAATVSGLSCHTLRFYEKSGLIYPISRDTAGHRFYREHDIRWLHFVQCLKSTGMPLKDIQQYAAKVGDTEHQAELLVKILRQHKLRLENKVIETQSFLSDIEWKINHYQEIITEHQS